jgi:hypothetical protein
MLSRELPASATNSARGELIAKLAGLSQRLRTAIDYLVEEQSSDLIEEAVVSLQDVNFLKWVTERMEILRNLASAAAPGEHVRALVRGTADCPQDLELPWSFESTADAVGSRAAAPPPPAQRQGVEAVEPCSLQMPSSVGPYRILQSLGVGSFGAVYKAEHMSTGKVVAVKQLKPHLANDPRYGEAFRQNFAEEAKTLMELRHPRIVSILSLAQHADPPYFVQQFIDVQTLYRHMKAKLLTVEQTLKLSIQKMCWRGHSL